MSDASSSIAGSRVTLRPTTDGDVPDLLALWNDPRVMAMLGFPDGVGYTAATARLWLHDTVDRNPNRCHFVVIAAGNTFCGEAHFTVDVKHRRAGLDIKLMPEAQGKGLATDALTTMIDHVFRTRPAVDECWTEPAVENLPARRLYERCGLLPKTRPEDLYDYPSYWAIERTRWERRGDRSR